MVLKVGINGFGRIGRVIFRKCFEYTNIELSAINDPAVDIEYICYLIKFDSSHGKFKGNVTYKENEIIINDKTVKVFRERLPTKIPWDTAGVHYVVEASGMFTCLEKASGHLSSEQVKRVIVTAPTMDIPMVILGVNEDQLKTEHKVLSCASSTLYCLAPIIKVLNDTFGVCEGFITSIHAMTPSLKPLDGLCLRGKHWKDHRSIHQNIIPASTGACKALGKIIPEVKDSLNGLAFRVPVVGVSVLDITIRLNKNTSIAEIVKSVEKASTTYLKNIIKISTDNAVSSDFIGDSNSCILDVDSCLDLNPNFFKLVCWYENEYSYACRVLDLIFHSEKQMCQPKLLLKSFAPLNTRNISTEITIGSNIKKGESKSSSVSLEKASRKVRSLNLKPSLSRTPTLDTNKYEIVKVWNDDCDTYKNNIREKCGSFFHCCVVNDPKSNKESEYVKTKQLLEVGKTDFSKMLTITEDLLKKSINKKIINLLTPHKRCKSNSIDTEGRLKSQEDSITKRELREQKVQKINYILKECNNFINHINKKSSSNIDKKDKLKSNEVICDKLENSSSYKEINKLFEVESIAKNQANKPIYERDTKNSKLGSNCEIARKTNHHELPLYRNVLETTANDIKQDEDAICLKDKLKVTHTEDSSESKQTILVNNNSLAIQGEKLEQKTNNLEIAIETVLSTEVKNICDSETSQYQPTTTKNNDEKVVDKEDNDEKVADKENNDLKGFTEYIKNRNINIINEELRKRNITLLDSEISGKIENIQLPVEIDDLPKISKHSNVLSLSSETRDPFKLDCLRKALNLSNGDQCRQKQDIYDKLDSTSATDSDGSYDVNDRKSQIINITDLTSSLEDLVRMDKICRIIEISDELSNDLFSALDNNEISMENKQWSFKDLCERIHLDSFCNKVFGHTGV